MPTHVSVPKQLDKFVNHEGRPKDLLLKPLSGTLPTSLSSSLASSHQLQQMQTSSTGKGAFFHNTYHHHQNHHHPASNRVPGLGGIVAGDHHLATSPASTTVVQNGGVDLDINVNAIKNMLMTTRVPESCV